MRKDIKIGKYERTGSKYKSSWRKIDRTSRTEILHQNFEI